MKFLKIWNVVLWCFLAYDILSVIVALVAGSALWWVSALSVLIIIGCLFWHRRTMTNYND